MTQGTEDPIEGTAPETAPSGAEKSRVDAACAGETAHGPSADLAAARAECEELRARLLRAQADYQNQRRRTSTDVDNAVQRSLQGILGGLLLVLDHLELALRANAASDDARALVGGVRLTRDQLLQLLRQHEVELMPPADRFDPARHEAVASVANSGLAPGAVVDTVRAGYTWRGRVLRPAHVRVAAAESPASSSSADHGGSSARS